MTKRVRLAVQMSGTRDGVAWPGVGSVVELPDDEAESMLRSGMARATDDSDVPENAVSVPDDVEEATDKFIPETARHEPAVGRENLPEEDRRPNMDVIALTDDGEIAPGPIPGSAAAEETVNMEEAAKTGLTTSTGPVRRVSRSRTTSTPKTESKSDDK